MTARRRLLWVTVAAVLSTALTARLGWWQLDRAAQKQALKALVEQRAQQPRLERSSDVAQDESAAAAQVHRPARLIGRWLSARTVYLDNRPMQGRVGFIVVTPLVLDDGRAVLVQRGWVPRDMQDRTRLPAVDTPQQPVVVVGRMAPVPSRLLELAAGDMGRIRQNLDLDSFGREIGLRLAPLTLLQTEPTSSADTLRREWPAPNLGVGKHHGYAFQWFGLSALIVTLYVWFQFIQPRRRAR